MFLIANFEAIVAKSPSSRSFQGKISRSRLLEGQIPHIFHSNYFIHKERQSHTYIHPIDHDADRHTDIQRGTNTHTLSEVDSHTHT